MTKKQKSIIFISGFILLLITLLNFANVKLLFSINSFINDKAFVLREKKNDENIVLVNVGALNRKELAQVVDTIQSYNPSVIGVQVCLQQARKSEYDSLLRRSLTQNNIVLFESSEDGSCRFLDSSIYGTASFIKDKDEVVRSFTFGDKLYFETEIARLYSKSAYNKLINRGVKTEQINYTGNMLSQFFTADHSQVLKSETAPDLFSGKIVLLGYLGPSLSPEIKSLEGALYTPLNERLNQQKVLPDMYSLVVSANVLSTIIQEKYIEEVPFFITILIIAAITIFNLLIGSIIIENSFSSYFLFCITAFVTEVFLAGMLIVWLLNTYNQMLYLKELPVAIALGFIAFTVIHYKMRQKQMETQAEIVEEAAPY